MRRGQINPRSWDTAIRAVQKELRELAAESALSDEQARILDAAVQRCEETTARKYLAWVSSNRELAVKYGICERTVRNWRRAGCPFDKGQAHVLKWIAARRYAPAGTEAKFAKQLGKLKTKAIFAGLPEVLAELRHVKWLYRQHGMQPEDWMRNFRAKRGKAQFACSDVYQPPETTPPTNSESTADPHG